MTINPNEFENPEGIPLIFFELDEIEHSGLHFTYESKLTGGRVDVLRNFQKPIANLPSKEREDILSRNEIF